MKSFNNNSSLLQQNICFTFDQAYDEVFFVVVTSILHNATEENKSKFHFFINYFGEINNIKELNKKVRMKFPNNNFTFKHIPSQFPLLVELSNSCYDFNNAPRQIQTSNVFCRFFLASIFPDVKGHMIHMDLDMIVKSDISCLFEIAKNSKTDYPIFACFNETIQEASIGDPKKFYSKVDAMFKNYPQLKDEAIELQLLSIFEKKYKSEKNSKHTAFNAGIFMFNLDIVREFDLEKTFTYCMRINFSRKIFQHNDQGILNFIFQDNAGKFPIEWNAMWFGCDRNFQEGKWFYRCVPQYPTSKLIHFNGPLKPWKSRKTDFSPAQLDWEHYEKLSRS